LGGGAHLSLAAAAAQHCREKSRCPAGASKLEEPQEARGAGATVAAVWGPPSHLGPSTLRRGGLGGAGIPGRGLKCGEERATAISSDLASAEAKKDRAHTDQGSRWGPAGALGRRHRKPKGVSLAGPRGPRGGQRQRKARGRGGIAGSSEIFIRLRGGKKSPRRHLVDHPPANRSVLLRPGGYTGSAQRGQLEASPV